MSAKQFNEMSEQEYRDLMSPTIHERDGDADRKADVDAEWLQQQQDKAFEAARDAGCFNYPHGSILADCDSLSLGDTLRQIAVDAYIESRSKPVSPQSLWDAFQREFAGDGKAERRRGLMGDPAYYPGAGQ